MMDFKSSSIEKIYAATEEYFSNKRILEADIRKAQADYKGQRLSQEVEKINQEVERHKKAAIETINSACDGMSKKLNERLEKKAKEGAKMDAGNITPDFEYLKLPVTLTEPEIMTLYERNHEDALFTRALGQYIDDRGITMKEPLSDGAAVRMNAVASIRDSFNRFITRNDETTMSVFTKCGSLSKLDDDLTGL